MPDEKKDAIDCLRDTGFFKPKKIYDGGKVIIGIIMLFGVVGFPFFYNMGKAAKAPKPKFDTPALQKLPEKERKCVEEKSYMRANHPKLLNDWRHSVVRNQKRVYTGLKEKKYEISLQNTCMDCHSNKKKFCDECHNYAGVIPYCWTCHIEPKEKE